ncbi:hypothetical protein RUM44_004993 [Polyplax serrata]|uniref:Uncharacterized protein n=1 Tax=Polyplax serrata TaxID=468196 RepID=A0ABR1AWL8_POLSC
MRYEYVMMTTTTTTTKSSHLNGHIDPFLSISGEDLQQLADKISQLHSISYLRDKTVKDDSVQRHAEQMSLLARISDSEIPLGKEAQSSSVSNWARGKPVPKEDEINLLTLSDTKEMQNLMKRITELEGLLSFKDEQISQLVERIQAKDLDLVSVFFSGFKGFKGCEWAPILIATRGDLD